MTRYYDPLHEYPARHEAGDETWTAYAAAVYAAAVARRDRDADPAAAPPVCARG